MNEHETKRATSGPTAWWLFVLVLGAIVLGIGGSVLALGGTVYARHYAGRIFPGVSVYGTDLSGLTVEEAAAVLAAALPAPSDLTVTVRAADLAGARTWVDVGLRFDTAATAHVAYQVGRTGALAEQREDQLRAFVLGEPLSAVVVCPGAAEAAALLEALAPELGVPPQDAALVIRADGIVPVPARAGREVDIQATIAALPETVRAGPDGLTLDLLTRQVAPTVGNTAPAQEQAEALLAHPFTLAAEDQLTGFRGTWTVDPDVLAGWMAARPAVDERGARLELTAEEEAVRGYLDGLGSQLPPEVAIDVDRSLPAVRAAIEDGESLATLALVHPPRTYVVQYGDTLTSVARAHGFPVWHLMQANVGIHLEELRPGQEIVIPSLDSLLPLPLITERRILIDISDQRLYAYEGQTLVYDYVCSTGIASSPTFVGTFQVLSKEDNAYASSWDLWMPHFLGIYESGPDFTNGIHALPILSSGARLWEGYLGSPVSYGCIVLGVEQAAALYEWAELGLMVVIQE